MQDPDNARLSPCALPYLASVPAIIVLLIALTQLLGPFLHRWRPKWTVPFVSEQHELHHPLPLEGVKHTLRWAIALFVLSGIGFAAEFFQLIEIDVSTTVLTIAWVRVLGGLACAPASVDRNYRRKHGS